MKWPQRWREHPEPADLAAGRITRLWRELEPLDKLSPEDHARIREHLTLVQAASERRSPVVFWRVAPLVLGMVAGAIAWHWLAPRPRGAETVLTPRPPEEAPLVRQVLTAPACGVARVSREGFELALAGPGHAVLVGGEIELDEGRLALETRGATLVVRTASGRAVLAPRSQGEIELRERGALRVAAYSSGVEWNGAPLEPKTEWSPSGVTSVASGAGEEAAALLQGEAPSCTPLKTEAPIVEAPVTAMPHSASRGDMPPPPAPAPPPLSPPPAADAPATKDSALAAETAVVRRAVEALRAGQPDQVLRTLEAYETRFPRRVFAGEVISLRSSAELARGNAARALALLDRTDVSELPRAREMAALRGWLRATASRCREALPDFQFALGAPLGGEDRERALYGMASCRLQLGDTAGGRADLEHYLALFPNGRFSAEARGAIGP